MSFLSETQRNILNSLSPNLKANGLELGDQLEAILVGLASGNLGITALAGDVDAVALGGGHFSRDPDNTSGLTFAWKASRYFNGAVNVTVAAGTLSLTGSATNYVELSRAGAVSANTTGFTAGRLPLWTIVTAVASITTVTSAKPLLNLLSERAITKELSAQLGTLAATDSKYLIAPCTGTLSGASLVVESAITANDTNYWTIGIVNRGQAGAGSTAMLAATDANTTKSTGGSGIGAKTRRAATLHGTAGNLAVVEGDVLELVFTKTASATDLAELNVRLDFLIGA